VRRAVRVQEGKIPSRGFYRRRALGNGTVITVWGRRMEVVVPERFVSLSALLRGPYTVFREAKERFP